MKPPVRLSIDDPDIRDNWHIAERIEVLLNGAIFLEPTAYDCEAGTVEHYLKRDGQPVIDPLTKTLVREVIHGDVTVRWKEAA